MFVKSKSNTQNNFSCFVLSGACHTEIDATKSNLWCQSRLNKIVNIKNEYNWAHSMYYRETVWNITSIQGRWKCGYTDL